MYTRGIPVYRYTAVRLFLPFLYCCTRIYARYLVLLNTLVLFCSLAGYVHIMSYQVYRSSSALLLYVLLYCSTAVLWQLLQILRLPLCHVAEEPYDTDPRQPRAVP